MGTINETGHHKNIANFAKLIAFAENLGSAYKPSNNEISLTALKSLHASATASLTDINTALPVWQMAVNERELAFQSIGKLSTRIVNALSVTGVDTLIVEDAKTISRKLQGRRVKPKKQEDNTTPENETDSNNSASQMSYDSRVENFDQLEKLISAQALYKPNETDLSKDTLSATLNNLRAKNEAVVNAYVPLSSKRIERDRILYNDTDGLVKIAGDVKRYIKSVLGADDPQYKQISGLRFRTEKK